MSKDISGNRSAKRILNLPRFGWQTWRHDQQGAEAIQGPIAAGPGT